MAPNCQVAVAVPAFSTTTLEASRAKSMAWSIGALAASASPSAARAVSPAPEVSKTSGGGRLNLRRSFRLTGLFILLVAAGLLAGALRKFHEAGVWNHLQQVVFDMSATLPMDSPLGAVLSGLLGYQAAPVVGEVIVYLVFLAFALFFFLRPAAPAPAATVPAR